MNNVIILLQKESDYTKFKNELTKISSAKIYALDYESHIFLENANIQHEIGDEILSENDFIIIDEITTNFIKNWIPKKLKEEFLLNDVFLPDLLEHELFSYLLSIFTSLSTIKKIINEQPKSRIIDFTQFSKFTESIILEKKNIQRISPNTEKSFYHDNIHLNFSVMKIPLNLKISRKRFQDIKKITTKITKKIIEPKMSEMKNKNILLVNFDPIQFELLLNEFKDHKINVILYNPRKPAVTNLKSLNIIKNSGCKVFDIYELEDSQKIIIQTYQKKIENILEEMFEENKYFQDLLKSLNIESWNTIKNSLKLICKDRLNESIKRIIVLTEFFKVHEIKLILQWAEVGQEEKECIYVGKNFDINSYMLQHGRFLTSKKWTQFSDFTGHFPHKKISFGQFVWGQFTKEFGQAQGYNPENIIISGSPKHDKYFNYNKTNNDSDKILIATTGSMNLSADTTTIDSQLKHDKLIIELFESLKKIPNKEIIVRTHPSPILTEHVEKLFKKLDSKICFVNNQNLIDVISDVDLVLTFNNSTICLDAIALNKPVITIQTDEWTFDEEIVQNKGVMAVRDIQKCEIYTKKLLFEKDFRENFMRESRLFLDKYFANQGTSSKFLAKSISDLI
ncbi:hypothetical protein OAJ50_04405 [Candidatus Nitrosopelagicus sp.]|nr:hypothetical protein [Candidatus Nitrosopelagicus sp.]